jgi:ABC-type branched-subunit amino acid transport system substrate-binding protein
MRKVLLVITAVVVAAVIGIFLYQPRQQMVSADGKPIVRIGVILPLTGDSAFAGVPVKDTLVQALKDIKSEEHLRYEYELVFEDNQNTPTQSILRANRLRSVDKVSAILSIWSPAGLAVGPFANENNIIHIGCAWGYETAQGKYSFNHATFPSAQTDALVRELKRNNIKSLGIIADAEKSLQGLVDLLLEKLKASNISVAFNTMITRGTTDFRTEILRMKQSDAEMVLMMMLPPGMNSFVRQKNELGYNTPMTSIEFFSFQPDLFEGYWYIGDALGTEEFGEYIQSKTGHNLGSCMANMYDALRLLINAYETSDTLDNEQVAEALLSTDTDKFDSVMGRIFIDEDGNIHTEATLKRIIDGQPTTVSE